MLSDIFGQKAALFVVYIIMEKDSIKTKSRTTIWWTCQMRWTGTRGYEWNGSSDKISVWGQSKVKLSQSWFSTNISMVWSLLLDR